MIIYLTKKTADVYKVSMPEDFKNKELKNFVTRVIEEENGVDILEWGAKLFYFDRKKSLQLVNFASKLTIFIFDIKMKDFEDIAEILVNYLFKIYENNSKMLKYIEKYAQENRIVTISKLKNKSIISTLNHIEKDYASYGDRFYDYFERINGKVILKTIDINKDINFKYLFKENRKNEYFYAGEKFEELLCFYYSENIVI